MKKRMNPATIMTLLTPDSPEWTKEAAHGTFKYHVDRIYDRGLLPGGTQGRGRRCHVHLVPDLTGSVGAKLKSGTDAIVIVDMDEYNKLGGVVYVSEQGVRLTEGIVMGREPLARIPPICIRRIVDRETGALLVCNTAAFHDDSET